MFYLPLTMVLANVPAAEMDASTLLAGTFTNEEQVYFDKAAGRDGPPWFALQIAVDGDRVAISEPDAFGNAADAPHLARMRYEGDKLILGYGSCERAYRIAGSDWVANGFSGACHAPASITRIAPDRIEMTYPDGKISELRRARPVSCWVAIRKTEPKQDGSEDWFFVRNVQLHDQGGRALVGTDTPGVDPVLIRVRNVTWDEGSTNKPVITLYMHKPGNPQRAEAYSWADPESERVGINLRWVQAGCSVARASEPSLSTEKNSR